METILGRICILCSLSLIISGCASSPSLTTTSSYNAFLNGDVRLDCNLPCSFKFGWNLPDIQKLYEAGKWQELAERVYTIGFNEDIAYFYLGRAAEELNKPKAAEIYYLLSQSALKCILSSCSVFSFPESTNKRLSNLKQKEVKQSPQFPSTITSNPSVQVTTGLATSPAENPLIAVESPKTQQSPSYSGDSSEKTLSKTQTEQNTVRPNALREQLNEVNLVSVGGVYEVPVSLNDVLKINIILDSGAADVSIAPDVALTLLRAKTIEKTDWLSGEVYQFADGSTAKSERFNLKSLKIGNREFKNIPCSIAKSFDAPMLLGQSLLRRLGKYTIDYQKGVIQFE
ncbi:MAG: retropepsin-like aspartic protease [Methylococcales bacterium]